MAFALKYTDKSFVFFEKSRTFAKRFSAGWSSGSSLGS